MKKTLKIMMMLVLVSILGACTNANSNTNSNLPSDSKQDKASIVGKWKGVKLVKYGKTDEGMTELLQSSIYEFKEDGTMLWYYENEVIETQTYTINGNTLSIEDSKDYTIKTLTKDKLVLERSESEEISEYERVK